jgi:hypothetical protein
VNNNDSEGRKVESSNKSSDEDSVIFNRSPDSSAKVE